MTFDPATLELLARAEEVRIETSRPDGSLRRTIIWVMVDGDQVYVRSVRGERGHWFQAAVDRPADVTLLIDDQRIGVAIEVADDAGSIEGCNRALATKYAGDPSLGSMLRPNTLATTLRLSPA